MLDLAASRRNEAPGAAAMEVMGTIVSAVRRSGKGYRRS